MEVCAIKTRYAHLRYRRHEGDLTATVDKSDTASDAEGDESFADENHVDGTEGGGKDESGIKYGEGDGGVGAGAGDTGMPAVGAVSVA